jgi:hypothetical protein
MKGQKYENFSPQRRKDAKVAEVFEGIKRSIPVASWRPATNQSSDDLKVSRCVKACGRQKYWCL